MEEKPAIWADDPEIDEAFKRQMRNYRIVIKPEPPTIGERWRAMPFLSKLSLIVVGGFVFPWAVLIGGVLSLALWDYLTRL